MLANMMKSTANRRAAYCEAGDVHRTKGRDVHLRTGDALLIVDVQNDFLPGGALAVADGNLVLASLNAWIVAFRRASLPIFATRDWHPLAHVSFKAQGGRWPEHCVAGSHGAAIADGLALPPEVTLINKGVLTRVDAYSGFSGTELDQSLRHCGVDRLFIGGLATDFCVHATVVDALRLNYQVVLLTDAVRAVSPADGALAISEMQTAGVVLVEGRP